jgi:hypothetical protein
MCALTIDYIDFDDMTDAQKKTLLRNLERKRKALQTQLEEVNKSLKGIDRCMKKVTAKKSKRRGK